jgi:hypothetical protein
MAYSISSRQSILIMLPLNTEYKAQWGAVDSAGRCTCAHLNPRVELAGMGNCLSIKVDKERRVWMRRRRQRSTEHHERMLNPRRTSHTRTHSQNHHRSADVVAEQKPTTCCLSFMLFRMLTTCGLLQGSLRLHGPSLCNRCLYNTCPFSKHPYNLRLPYNRQYSSSIGLNNQLNSRPQGWIQRS